jgi:linearmycin/streptolysin S transport system ATP-binding protein
MAPPAISVKRLAMDRGGRRVLDDITFDVAPGEVVGLLGPNGAGKTTTLGVLATLLPYDAGEIRIAGHDLRTEKRAVRAAIGRVPQEIAVYPTLTARENAVFFARLAGLRGAAARRAAAEALEEVGLEQRADEPASTYSGGMQRRLNLACGLLGEPRVVLLDEATVGVDPQSLESIVAALRRHKDRGAALLYSTHHMKEAEQLCDRVVLIDHGRVIALGTPQEVVAQAGLELAAEVVTERSLPERWLEGLDGAQVLESHARGLDETGSFARVSIAELAVAARVLAAAESHSAVRELHVQRPSLHDAFLALTGRATRD